MSKKFPPILFLTTVALATIGALGKPGIAAEIIVSCDVIGTPTIKINQEPWLRLDERYFDSRQEAIAKCQRAALVLENLPNREEYKYLSAQNLEQPEGGPVVCILPDDKGTCDEETAVKLFAFALKEDAPRKALSSMLDLEDENRGRIFNTPFAPTNWRNW